MVKFESFKSFPGVVRAIPTARNMVEAEREWLEEARPDVVHRNRSWIKAATYFGRALLDPNLTSGALRTPTRVIGLGTVISHASFRLHMSGEVYEGRQIDYWTRDRVSFTQHDAAVRSLATHGGYEGVVLAAVTPQELVRASGLEGMEHVASPGEVEVLGDDRYGLRPLQDRLHLFAMEIPTETRL
jgi:hypothetical protein